MRAEGVTDVAVVGGGVLGCSAALHLKLLGCETVTLVERGRIADGTTSAGAGLLARWSAGFVPAWGDDEREIETYGLDFYRDLAQAGHELGLAETGTLFIGLAGPAGRRSLRPFARDAAGAGLELLGPDEVEELTSGFVRAAGVAGGALDPRGGGVAARSAARAFACRFAGLGGLVLEHEPVIRVRQGARGGFVLETENTRLSCTVIVLAAGAWTNALLRPLGQRLPLVPLVATRLSTEGLAVPPALPSIQCCDGHRLYARAGPDGLVWGCNYETDPRYAFVERDPPDQLDGLGTACVHDMQRVARAVRSAMPALAAARPTGVVHGAPCFTPDLRPLLGELDSVPGLYVLAGDNYAGLTHAPGAGRLVAELVGGTHEPFVDAGRYRPERFDDGFRNGAEVVTGMRWTATRSVLTARAGAT
jgi:glycine/D-amino acid oxidase-like deaminating enzyme